RACCGDGGARGRSRPAEKFHLLPVLMDAAMWRRFLRAFAITGAGALMLVVALVLLVDPLGVSPIGLFEPKAGYAMKDRRFLVQQLIRSGQFDSFLLGSSTIH